MHPKVLQDDISLSAEEEETLCQPWRFSIIIKVLGMCTNSFWMSYEDLLKKLILIDLGWDIYTIKFRLEEKMIKALYPGL